MRIAMVSPYPPSKGTLNEYAYHLVRVLRKKDMDVSELIVLSDELSDGHDYEPDIRLDQDVPLRVIPAWRFGAWNNPLRILKAVRQHKPDIVLFNIHFASFGDGKVSATLGLLSVALVKAAGFPTVVLLHNIMETVDLRSAGFGSSGLMEAVIRFFGSIVTRLVLQVDMVSVTIPKYVEILRHKYRASNVFLIPHGAFEDEIAAPSLELPPGPPKVMTFGKFGTYKKIETLIEALQLLRADGHPSLELVVAGSDSPNARGYLDGVRERYSQVPGVHFTGYVAEEDIPRIFSEAAVVIFPYTSTTGSSGVLHQAGSYAKAVVLPNLGDFAELIAEEGYTGEFFEPEDARSLGQAIARVIDNPERRREIGTQNFMASQGIRIDEVADWYLLHFETLIDERRRAKI